MGRRAIWGRMFGWVPSKDRRSGVSNRSELAVAANSLPFGASLIQACFEERNRLVRIRMLAGVVGVWRNRPLCRSIVIRRLYDLIVYQASLALLQLGKGRMFPEARMCSLSHILCQFSDGFHRCPESKFPPKASSKPPGFTAITATKTAALSTLTSGLSKPQTRT